MRKLMRVFNALLFITFFSYIIYFGGYKPPINIFQYIAWFFCVIHIVIGLIHLFKPTDIEKRLKRYDKFVKNLEIVEINLNSDEKEWWNEQFKIKLPEFKSNYVISEEYRFEVLEKDVDWDNNSQNNKHDNQEIYYKIKQNLEESENKIQSEIDKILNDDWWNDESRFKILYYSEGFISLLKEGNINELNKLINQIKINVQKEEEEIKLEKEKKELEIRLSRGEKSKSNEEPFCSWCGDGYDVLEYIDGSETGWDWHFRNKDGSKDQRAKDNYQVAGFVSNWKCQNCNSNLKARHFSTEKPSKKVEIWKLELITNGDGERVSDDWESDKGVSMAGAHHRQHEN